MNHRQKIVQEQFLNNEEAVIKRLKQVYNQSLKDITSKSQALQDDINRLGTLANLATDAEEKATFLSMQQSKVYQKQYQDALKKQIGSVLDNMQVEEFKTVSEYLTTCYEDGFIGTMFDLQGQGIPLCFPLDQEAMVRAVQLDSKISQGLYSRLGEDVTLLKKKITAQVSRGIATGQSFQQVAQQLSAYTNIGYNNAIRIARTEGHRIQVQAGMDACYKAKDMGADVVKQWDATLDDSTRESHVAVDGEIRELDEKFSNGLMFPGDPSGGAAEVVNCRCALLQRARWALDDSFTKMNNKTGVIVDFSNIEDYKEFKRTYLEEAKNLDRSSFDITENGKYKIIDIDNKNDYADYIEHDFITQKLSVKELRQMWQKDGGYIQNSQGYQDINGYMRGLKDRLDNAKCNVTMRVMQRVTDNNVLTKDCIGIRKVDASYLENVLGIETTGLFKNSLQKNSMGRKQPVKIPKDSTAAQEIARKINGLVGTERGEIKDNAFTSVSMSENLNYFTHYPVKFEIQMPSGTKGLITDNLDESEFIAKSGSTLEIIGATVYNDGNKDCVKVFAKMLQR